jgi:anaerobic magnesium-protoporphyrin IX monomethyl ester cyclase
LLKKNRKGKVANDRKVILITTDNHTLGIQMVAKIIHKNKKILPELIYLPSNLPKYPPSIETKIMRHTIREIDDAKGKVLIGFQLRELSLEKSIQLAHKIKQYRGNKVILVAGGTHATAEPSAFLHIFDYVVVGSGEGILKIFDAVFEGKEVNPIVMSPPTVFEYPLFMDCWVLDEHGEITKRRLRPLIHPQYKIINALEMTLGVGCSYSCSYCEVATLRKLFGTWYKISFAEPEQSIELMKKEIDLDSSIQYIYFFDEDFLLKPTGWIERFASLYQENIGLPFFIFATPSTVKKFPNKIFMLSQAGLDMINMGIQSGSERITKSLYGRKESKKEIKNCVEFLANLYLERKTSSPPMLDFIILNPYEKVDDLLETIHLIMELPIPFNAIMHCMSFFKGTPLYDKARDDGKIPKAYRFKYDLHDFMSRLRNNEFQLDYSKEESLQWLFLNVLLYGMRGLHQEIDGKRYLGNLLEEQLNELINHRKRTYLDIISLADSFPDPMDEVNMPWEKEVYMESSLTVSPKDFLEG